MTYRKPQREQFYQDLLADVEPAVSDWARTERLVRRVSEGWKVFEVGASRQQIGSPYVVTVDTIASGWRNLLELEKAGKFQHCDEADTVRAAERSLTADDGGEDYDLCVVDAVVQMAMLGELRYPFLRDRLTD